jgi:hypothetical protein
VGGGGGGRRPKGTVLQMIGRGGGLKGIVSRIKSEILSRIYKMGGLSLLITFSFAQKIIQFSETQRC